VRSLCVPDTVGEHSIHSYSNEECKRVIYAIENGNRSVGEKLVWPTSSCASVTCTRAHLYNTTEEFRVICTLRDVVQYGTDGR